MTSEALNKRTRSMNETAIAKELAAIRNIVSTTSNDVSALTQIVKIHEEKFQTTDASMERKFAHIDSSMERMSRRAADDKKAPWLPLMAALTLVVLIVGGIGGLSSNAMWRIIELNSKGVAANAANEVSIADPVQDSDIKHLYLAIDKINIWLDEHKVVNGLNAAQWERTRALERKVFGNALNIEFK